MALRISARERFFAFVSRCIAFFHIRRLDADLDDELRSHIDLAIEEKMALGMSEQHARTEALRSFGGVTQTRESYRTQQGVPALEQFGRDLRYGVRQLWRSPGFSLTAILT